jgi:hypothetical protein
LILETTTKKMHNMDFVDKIRIFVLSNFYMWCIFHYMLNYCWEILWKEVPQKPRSLLEENIKINFVDWNVVL